MTIARRILVVSLLPFLVPAASAQVGSTYGGYGSYGNTYGRSSGTTFNGTRQSGRDGADGPDLWAGTFDPRDDDETWDARFVTDLLWEQPLEQRPVTGPLTLGDRLLVAFADRTLRAYASEDGSTLLRLDLPGDVVGGLEPLPSGDLVLVTLQGDVLRVNPTSGAIVFRAHLAQEVRTGPVAGKDIVLLAAKDDVVFALDAKTGAVKWRAATGGHALTAPAPSPDGGRIVVGDREGRVHALDAGSGKSAWVFEGEAAVTAAPACSGRRAFVVTADRKLHALDLDDGDVAWKRRLGGSAASAPLVADDDEAGELVILATSDNVFQAIRTTNGFRAWKTRLERRVFEAPQRVGPVVWLTPSASREMEGFMLRNGYPLGKAKLSKTGDYGVGRGAPGERLIAMATYGRALLAFKRITSRQVEDGEEKLPERLAGTGLGTSQAELPTGTLPALPAEPVPGEMKKKGLTR